jgi:type I restriction enzyme S subunit
MSDLPKGWRTLPLSDLGDWYGGGTPSKASAEFWADGTVPWLSPKDMGPDVLKGTQDKIHASALGVTSVKAVPAGSVAIVVRSGILERTLPVALVPFETTLNQDMKAVHPIPEVLAEWIAWGIRSGGSEFLGRVRKSGTTVASIEVSRLMKQELPIPPLEEQRRIVAILEDHLSHLDAVEVGLSKTSSLLGGLRNRWLETIFSGEDSWTAATLGDVAAWCSGGTPSTGDLENFGGGIPWVVIGDLTESWVESTEKTLSQSGLDGSSARLLPPGTVMLAMYGASIGRTGKMATHMATNQAIACAWADHNRVTPDFLLWYVKSQKERLIRAGKGGAQPNISQRVVKLWPIRYPSLDVQRRIVDELEVGFEHFNSLGTSIVAIRSRFQELRRSLLSAAFSGQLTGGARV